jgi:hypothetical protein
VEKQAPGMVEQEVTEALELLTKYYSKRNNDEPAFYRFIGAKMMYTLLTGTTDEELHELLDQE